MSFDGAFPFGRPSTRRPPRRPERDAKAFVLGVYPSALHVEWMLPSGHQPKGRVAAMAVDVEPSVFWDGVDPDPDEQIQRWRETVGFTIGDDADCDGQLGPVRLNGSSGAIVRQRVLLPLGLDFDTTWLTDALPFFFVKYGTKDRREQGDVLDVVFNPFAVASGRWEPARLPRRPSPTGLVRVAAGEEQERLRGELLESGSPVVLTLGEEARQVLAAIADRASGPPTNRLSVEDYGGAGDVVVDGRTVRWHALVHPGQRSRRWAAAHDAWTAGGMNIH